MSGQLEIPFAIGQQLWWVGNGYQEETITCPECLGTKVVTLTLGNGEQYSLDCAGCSRGYEGPYGVVTRKFYKHIPTPFTPHRVRMDGNEIAYSAASPDARAYGSIDAKMLFATEAECLVKCEQMNEERTKAEAEHQINQLMSKRRDLAWSVHYWRSQMKKLEKDLEIVKARLNRCKEIVQEKEKS